MQEIPSLKRLIKEFNYYLIEGKKVLRRKFEPKQKELGYCGECFVTRGSYHKLGCLSEPAVCQKCKFAVQCECSVRPGESV